MPPARRTRSRARPLAAVAACAVAIAAMLGAAGAAEAKTRWVVKGKGYGHGVGMSQWGAYGFARLGTPYKAILAHYYTGTTVGTTSPRTVRVLLRSGLRSARFSGAAGACGRSLNPSKVYIGSRKGAKVLLRNRKGRRLAGCGAALRTTGGSFRLLGKGAYRGALELRARSRGLTAINFVDIESYVRGVISRESPSSWPMDALRAQAVAARSYAIATTKSGAFDHYDDTRSQVYGGIRAETTRTNQAVIDTTLQVVLYKGQVAQTYFFSTSGGHTEHNENSVLGGVPLPYLRGVPDPYDSSSPYHRWRRKFSPSTIKARLGSLVRGRLKRIEVIRRGVSPRIVKARVVGTAGVRKARGATLRARLGLPDTWANFKKVKGARAGSTARLWLWAVWPGGPPGR